MLGKSIGPVLTAAALAAAIAPGSDARRTLSLDDLARMREVRDPQCAPDGRTIAFVVATTDVKEDKNHSHIWTVDLDGRNERQLTFSTDGESSPKFSPDGRYLAFTSSRPGRTKGNQVWLLDRRGGEAAPLTELKGRLQAYEWSPDSRRLALVVGDPDPDAPDAPDAPGTAPAENAARPRVPKPIVIDRYKFKQDVQGYLLSTRHSYIYLFDLESKELSRLTSAKADESSPSWSPDGRRLAFLSNHGPDPDREPSSQVFVADAMPGSTETALTPETSRAARGKPEWSPDGASVAFLESDEKRYGAYNMDHLALVPSDGSRPPARVPGTEALDRGVSSPRFSTDGRSITVLVTDDRSVYPARVMLGERGGNPRPVILERGGNPRPVILERGGNPRPVIEDRGGVARLIAPPVVVTSPTAAGGCAAVLSGSDSRHTEVYRIDGVDTSGASAGAGAAARLTQLSHQNDALFAELQLAGTEEVAFPSQDGTDIHGLLTKPVGHVTGTKVPLLLRIHGGPNGQDQHAFSFERQWFAANGYGVLAVNYRGSAGRGAAFSKAIAADWGHFEVDDLRAGIDYVIKMGLADPARVGVGGWSYGGILTDYLIASDTRFKAATSGAGTGFTVAFYGTDQYIIQYDYEIGPPWEPQAWATYQKISYPFLHADRIKTPTLFLGGERDFNVPVQGGQQMYQALRSLGVDAQLVIYPNEFHGITRPSYVRDRYERYLAWYDKYLKKAAATTTSSAR
jgi:dipeptidyl aminopeptidase/acylaminoacyl peptidase